MKRLIPILTGLVFFLNSCVETDRETGYEKALEFYKKYGFEQLPDSEKMFLPMKVIEQLI